MPGPTTTASLSDLSAAARASTWPSIVRPAILCSTLGSGRLHARAFSGGQNDDEKRTAHSQPLVPAKNQRSTYPLARRSSMECDAPYGGRRMQCRGYVLLSRGRPQLPVPVALTLRRDSDTRDATLGRVSPVSVNGMSALPGPNHFDQLKTYIDSRRIRDMAEKTNPVPVGAQAPKSRFFTPYVSIWAVLAGGSPLYLALLATQPRRWSPVSWARSPPTKQADDASEEKRAMTEAVAEVRTSARRDHWTASATTFRSSRAEVSNQNERGGRYHGPHLGTRDSRCGCGGRAPEGRGR